MFPLVLILMALFFIVYNISMFPVLLVKNLIKLLLLVLLLYCYCLGSSPLIDLAREYNKIEFSLCTICLAIFGSSSNSFLQMCNKLGIDNHQLNFIICIWSTIIMRTTCYLFCMRKEP